MSPWLKTLGNEVQIAALFIYGRLLWAPADLVFPVQVTKVDYGETLQWMKEELRSEMEEPTVDIPVDKPDCDFLDVINPREIKLDPRSIANAAKVKGEQLRATGAKLRDGQGF